MTGISRGVTLVALLASAALGSGAWAEDRALVIGNENYSDAADIAGADRALAAADALERAGFRVASGEDLTTQSARRLLSDYLASALAEDRLVILLSGHFARSSGQTWYLGTESSVPDLGSIGASGVSVQTVLEIAALSKGGAVVLLGTETRRLPLGPGLEQGIGSVVVPQGVTLVRGDAAAIAEFAAGSLTQTGISLPAMLDAAPDLTAEGFLSPLVPFRTATAAASPPPAADPQEAFWRATKAIGTVGAYQGYLNRYPKGAHVAEAQAEIARLRPDPLALAEAAEQALALTRDDRRTIQRELALLGHDPRGIDGVFGPGSRGAIKAWQTANKHTATGFLTRDQITGISAQAAIRAAELEAEAEARRVELERQDRLYWDQTGASGTEVGLRAYVQRYPDGLYADVAAAELKVFDDARRAATAAEDNATWARAQEGNTLNDYQAYLAAFPQGAHAAEAQAKIDAITGANSAADDARKQAEATEAALNLAPLAKNLVERRLEMLGFDPGAIDGTFDNATRRAIRRFQTARELTPTGYLDQPTMVNLLAGGKLN